ncbi:MAG TPA: hypothetical protein VGI14_10275 [Casimicrobiaceae bacterium]|jgi:hypothetical protein
MALNTAIRHLKNGDWAKAHAVVQNDSSHMGCWAHGIVHMLEGDIGNARYWYRRAGRPFPRERDASAEIDALVAEMKSQASTQTEQPRQQQAQMPARDGHHDESQ